MLNSLSEIKFLTARCVFIGALFFVFNAHADTLYLKNGRQIEGIIAQEDDQALVLEVPSGNVTFAKKEIERIERDPSYQAELLRSKWQEDKQAFERKLARQRAKELMKPQEAKIKGKDSINVKAMLNNSVEASLTLDTGASLVVINEDLARKLNYDPDLMRDEITLVLADGRNIKAKSFKLRSVKVEDAEAVNVEAAVLTNNQREEGVDGLLGMSFLNKFDFQVNQREKKLILHKR